MTDNHKQLLVSYLFPVSNKKNHCYVQQFCYLEKIIEENNIQEVFYISFNSTKMDINKILSLSKFKYPNLIKHINLSSYLDELILKENSWNNVSEKLINYLQKQNEYNINFSNSEIYIFGGILFNQKNYYDLYEYYYDNLKSSSFVSAKLKLAKFFLFYNLLHDYNIKTNHIIFDPVEIGLSSHNNLNYTKFHNYNDLKLHLKRLDSLQYQLLNKEENINLSKIYDFTFGASIIHKSRMDLHNHILDIILKFKDNPKSNIFYQNKFIPSYNSFIIRPDYINLIKQSKFTYVIRAYEKSSFSASRFIEAIYYKCIPLLSYDSNYQLLESLGFKISWIEKLLVVNSSNDIYHKINNLDYEYIITKLYNCLF